MNVFEDDIPGDKRASRKRLRGLRKQIDNLIEDVRRISTNLRPMALDQFGLVTALRHLTQEFQKTNKMDVSFETHLGSLSGLGMQIDIAIYRIAQEALTNAAKHSGAKSVSVLLSCSPPSSKLVVQDNGRGFHMKKGNRSRRPGLGLMSMQERAEILGGTFTIESVPRKGVTVSVEIPLSDRAIHEEDQDTGR